MSQFQERAVFRSPGQHLCPLWPLTPCWEARRETHLGMKG